MAFLALLLIAAPAGPDAAPSLMPGAEGFDLAQPGPAARCGAGPGSEIVVCGRRKNDEIRVRDAGRFEQKPLKAETRLGGASLDVHAEQRSLPDGRSGPAAMVRIRIPF